MSRKIVMGIDTSNYTTSVALLTADGELIANIKRPLPVKQGERGLRQSDAVFAHIKNMPLLMKEAKEYLNGDTPIALGVSTRPRNIEGSYMPCFLAGVMSAESISAAAGVPLYTFSHQCGHIMAALYSSGRSEYLEKEFSAFHVSGGTTEVLRVTPLKDGFSAELVGGSADLNAGQVIDRIGVSLGLSFPSGRELEALAIKNTAKIPRKIPKIVNMKVNFSGLENMALSLYKSTENKELTAAFVFDYIGRALVMLAEAYEERFGTTGFVFAGGVMCNSIIKSMLAERFDSAFAEPLMSADNAVGIAALALRRYNSEKRT